MHHRSHELAAFAHDSDAVVFLPKHATLSHHDEDPKEDIEDIVAGSHGREGGGVEKGEVWRFLMQPFTWISMLCR